MQTDRNKKRRGKAGRINIQVFGQKKKIEPGNTSAIIPDRIFRSDLLNYSPAEKSGYLLFKNHRSWEKPLKNKNIALKWHACLKNHPKYKKILIQKEASYNDALDLLHQETNRLFKNYDWVLFIDADNSICIYYYESIGSVANYGIPMNWFWESENEAFKKSGLWMMKSLSNKFGFEIMNNDLFIDYVLEEIENPISLMERLKDLYGYDQHDCKELHPAFSEYRSYHDGEPKKLENYLKTMAEEKPKDFNSNVNSLLNISQELFNWFQSGINLLKGKSFHIKEYDLTPHDLDKQDGSPVLIDTGFFMPYTFNDAPYNDYENWINDISNSIGVNDIFSFGVLSEQSHVLPLGKDPLQKLINFLEEGRRLYFYLKILQK